MVMYGCTNVMSCSYNSLEYMNIMYWLLYGAENGLHAFKDPNLV